MNQTVPARGSLLGRSAIVTGAGRGLGRAHAIALAAEGASVVVNDFGVGTDGASSMESPAQAVVEEIQAAGGTAIASVHDVSDWAAAEALVRSAIDAFGSLDILVNNAGILRDRTLANVSEGEWDDVIRIHLKGHAATTRHAMAYWRAESKLGRQRRAAIINTTSIAGLFPNFGQASYCAAKAGIVALTQVTALEGASFGVRANAVSPSAMTRLVQTPVLHLEASALAELSPDRVSPVVVWLAQPHCQASGQVYQIYGLRIGIYRLTQFASIVSTPEAWTLDGLEGSLRGEEVPLVTAEAAMAMLVTRRVP